MGTLQSHDDALVVTLRIGGYDVKMVLIDQGSSAGDLTRYNSPLIGFDSKIVFPKG